MKLRLRPAARKDVRLLWNWANDPVTRRWAYRTSRIPWKSHVAWFSERLARKEDCRIYIAERGRRAVGQVRFEAARSRRLVVGVSVAPHSRGRGIGTRLLELSVPRAVGELGISRVVAYIKKGNAASLAAFTRAGFRRGRCVRRHGISSLSLIWTPGRRGGRR